MFFFGTASLNMSTVNSWDCPLACKNSVSSPSDLGNVLRVVYLQISAKVQVSAQTRDHHWLYATLFQNTAAHTDLITVILSSPYPLRLRSNCFEIIPNPLRLRTKFLKSTRFHCVYPLWSDFGLWVVEYISNLTNFDVLLSPLPKLQRIHKI